MAGMERAFVLGGAAFISIYVWLEQKGCSIQNGCDLLKKLAAIFGVISAGTLVWSVYNEQPFLAVYAAYTGIPAAVYSFWEWILCERCHGTGCLTQPRCTCLFKQGSEDKNNEERALMNVSDSDEERDPINEARDSDETESVSSLASSGQFDSPRTPGDATARTESPAS